VLKLNLKAFKKEFQIFHKPLYSIGFNKKYRPSFAKILLKI